MRSLLLPVVLAALASGCGDVLFLEGEAAALCHTVADQRLPLARLPATTPLTLRWDFSRQLEGAEVRARLSVLRLSATHGDGHLGALEAASLALLPPGDGAAGAERVVLRYAKREPAPTRVELSGEPLDLTPWLRAGTVSGRLAVEAAASDVALTVDAELCVAASARLNYAR